MGLSSGAKVGVGVGGGVLGALCLMVGLVVAFLNGYRGALASGRNSMMMRLLGRKRVSGVLAFLFRKVMAGRDTSSAMNREARAKLRRLQRENVDGKLDHRVLFCGSSTFTYWRLLDKDMNPLPVVNAAFGGSKVGDWTGRWAKELVMDFHPQAVVYYCGANDLSTGASAQACLDGFAEFVAILREHNEFSSIPIFYLSITESLHQQSRGSAIMGKIEEANKLLEAFCAEQEGLFFISTAGLDWINDESNYMYDNHHFNDKGHELLGNVIRPEVQNKL